MSGRRSPSHLSRPSGKQPVQQLQQKKIPAELVTYRLDAEMVYVEPARDYEQALDYAQSVFPQLAEVPRSRIAFLVNVRVNGNMRKVRIAPMAWSRVLQSLATYEIVDLSVLPDSGASRAAKSDTDLATSSQSNATTVTDDAPPKYVSGSMLGDDLMNPTLNMTALRDSEKSPLFTLQTTENLDLPPSPVVKRCSSALSWFSKRL